MRKLLFAAIGLWPTLAFAADPAALSPWVQEVLQRARDGVQTVQTYNDTGASSCSPGEEAAVNAAQNAQSFLREFVDTRRPITQESVNIFERTSCLQYDINLLEDELATIADAMTSAANGCKDITIERLKYVYTFVACALDAVEQNGMNAGYSTDMLKYNYVFDSQDFSDAIVPSMNQKGFDRCPLMSTKIKEDTSSILVCPFTTDYAPPSVGAVSNAVGSSDMRYYGCDASVIDAAGVPDTDGQKLFASRLSSWVRGDTGIWKLVDDAVVALYNGIQAIRGLPDTKTATVLQPPLGHDELTGCLQPEQLPKVDLRTNPDALSVDTDAYPYALLPPLPTASTTLPMGLLLRNASDGFSIFPNPRLLLEAFTAIRMQQGAARPLEWVNDDFWVWLSNAVRGYTYPQKAANNRAQMEQVRATIEFLHRDGVERSDDLAEGLVAAVSHLGDVTNAESANRGELPKYLIDLAYFLRRECVYGYCSDTLDSVLRRLFEPACFPYRSGIFRTQDVAQKCFQ